MRGLACTGAAALVCIALPAVAWPLKAAGLKQPNRILIHTRAGPHIYAARHKDTFFVQGFNAARDRLCQIDLWRRRGLDELVSVFGPTYVEQDRAARLFLYCGGVAPEWAACGKGCAAHQHALR